MKAGWRCCQIKLNQINSRHAAGGQPRPSQWTFSLPSVRQAGSFPRDGAVASRRMRPSGKTARQKQQRCTCVRNDLIHAGTLVGMHQPQVGATGLVAAVLHALHGWGGWGAQTHTSQAQVQSAGTRTHCSATCPSMSGHAGAQIDALIAHRAMGQSNLRKVVHA